SIVKALVSGGFHGMAQELGSAAAATMAAIPAKGAMVLSKGKAVAKFGAGKLENHQAEKKRRQDMNRM
ncbi:hypothetical protein, partial [Clostridioides difficile]|uniref:hypothetical protein n=1 Tax=Clostridioides difficile TaxID=1496 RepID=UPI001A9BB4D7